MNSRNPNIVFFFTDDQRFDTINALGNENIITPNMDALANSGTTFGCAHIPGGTTAAVCMPSRAMIHSGKSLFHLEDSGSKIPADHPLLGETLRKNGYRTSGIGKWHNGPDAYARSFTDGDEIFFGGMDDHWNVPAFHYDPQNKYDKFIRRISDPKCSRDVQYIHADHVTAGKHSSELFADAAVHFIESKDFDNPFFMYVSFMAPHDPRSMPDEFLHMYDELDIELPPNFSGGHAFDNGELKVRDELLAPFPRDPDEIKQHIKEYYAMITHADHEIGRIVAALKDAGEFDNTIFVFAGDNGLALGQHGLMGKQNCYDHSVRVPLIFSGPGIAKGVRNNSLVYLSDIFPTLCELIGIEIPEGVDSVSLKDALSSPEFKVRESLYLAYGNVQRGVTTGEFKLIEYVVGNRHVMTQLFDLKNDPWETRNLAKHPEYAEALRELRSELFKLRDESDDVTTEFGKNFWNIFITGEEPAIT